MEFQILISMKYVYKLILIISLFASHLSCEEEATLDLKPGKPRLVIDAAISEEVECTVKLTLTQSFYDNIPYQYVSGATVTLSDDMGYFEELREEVGKPGEYVSYKLGEVGVKYTLKVTVDGESYESTVVIPKAVQLEEIYVYEIKAGNKSYYSPSVFYQDPAGERNYYYTKVTVNDRTLKTLYLHDDDSRDGKRIHRVLFFDKEANGGNTLQTEDNIDVEMQTIDYGMYEFYRSWSSFVGGDSNPTTNFTGDVLGCFKAYNSSYISMVVNSNNIYEENN